MLPAESSLFDTQVAAALENLGSLLKYIVSLFFSASKTQQQQQQPTTNNQQPTTPPTTITTTTTIQLSAGTPTEADLSKAIWVHDSKHNSLYNMPQRLPSRLKQKLSKVAEAASVQGNDLFHFVFTG